MQLDLFQSLSRSQPGRSVDPSPGSTLMVFAVTERVEQELRRRVAQKSGPLQGIESDAFMLFHEFFEKLCDETLRYASRTSMDVWFRGRRRASRVELELIVRRILQDFYWGRPGIFARVARRNGFVAALLQFFDECREGHTSETTLQEFITAFHEEHGESVEVRVARLEELTSLFGRYERALTQLKLLDPGLTLRVALESVRDRRFPLPGMLQRDHIRFRDIYDWSPVRIDIVRELAGRMREESTRRGRFVEDHVEIHLPYDFNRPSLFHYLEPILRQIESLEGEALTICWDENGGMCLDGPGRARPLEALARSVWSEAGGVRSRLREIGRAHV